ncbi:MAG TPA: hypothetical protein VF558_00115, partial [Rubrobacteraceae bacterium]
MCGKIASTDDAALASIPTFHPNGALPMVTPAAVGAFLILFGIALLIVDLGVTNHGLPAAGGVVALLAGGLAML